LEVQPGVHGDHRDAAVGGHLGQPIAELPGGDPGHDLAEPLAAPAATKGLPADLTRVGKVQVLDADGGAAPLASKLQQGADRRAHPPVAGRGREAV
jgi:hypothetical protein